MLGTPSCKYLWRRMAYNDSAMQGLLNKLASALTLRAAEVRDDVDHGVGIKGMHTLVPGKNTKSIMLVSFVLKKL